MPPKTFFHAWITEARRSTTGPKVAPVENFKEFFRTKTWLCFISKSLRIRIRKATWNGRQFLIHALSIQRFSLTRKKNRGDSKERPKWHLLRILNIISTKIWVWRISKGLRIRRKKATWNGWQFLIHVLSILGFFHAGKTREEIRGKAKSDTCWEC